MKYPIAKKTEFEQIAHGVTLKDEYRWMHDKSSEEVIEYIGKENAYVTQEMDGSDELQENIYQEIRGRVVEADESVRTRYKEYEYFSRTFEGKEYVAYFRIGRDGDEECLLDGNVEAEGKDFWAMRGLTVSPNGTHVFYATDESGEELYSPHVKDLSTGEILDIDVKISNSGVVFDADESGVYFVLPDKSYRPYQVCRYDFGSGEMTVMFEESDARFFVSLDLSKDEKTMYICSDSEETSRRLWREYEKKEDEFVEVIDRVEGHNYEAVRYDGFWLFLTDRNEAKNFELVKVPNGKNFWSESEVLISESQEYHLDGVDEFRDFVVVYKTGNARNEIDILRLDTGEIQSVDFTTDAHVLGDEEVNEYDGRVFRFSYENAVQPGQVWEMNIDSGERTLLKEQSVKGGFEASEYEVEQRWYESIDGVRVSATVMYKKGTVLENAPVYLYGYGSYGISTLVGFSLGRLSLLDRGVVYVVAHIRGGGDLGKYWYLDGKFRKKKHTFEDFIAVADGLCANGVTSPEKLAIHGGSAGGLLIGAVMNMRPDLFVGAIADVPFVDMMNTMLDDTLPLTVNEYEEWGDPNEKKFFDYMLSYAPYENIQSGVAYPKILVIGGLNDPRVMYWEPLKWVARLRDSVTNPEDILCKIYMSGHLGTTGRFSYLREVAFRYAYMLRVLGIKE